MKNVADFAIAVSVFWLVGFGIMFGDSHQGLIGTTLFGWQLEDSSSWVMTVFIFQAMFCATAATIVSGAVAERMPFLAYTWTALWIALPIYPVFGHWAWGGLLGGAQGWLGSLGFIDFAGSTVVHSVGGWVALALPWVADLTLLDSGLSRSSQFFVQLIGVGMCGIWSFGSAWLLFRITQCFLPIRVSLEAEKICLNLAEHGANNEFNQLLKHMRQHEQQGDMRQRIDADPLPKWVK